MASFVLYETSRGLFKGHVTMDEMVFNQDGTGKTVARFSPWLALDSPPQDRV
jgi:hypothetical protein